MSETTQIQAPFSTGTQFMDWQEANCCRCVKAAWKPEQEMTCDLQRLVFIDGMFDLSVFTPEINKRLGYLDENGEPNGRYCWQCTEWEPTEEWKIEWRRMRGKPDNWEPSESDEARQERGQLALEATG